MVIGNMQDQQSDKLEFYKVTETLQGATLELFDCLQN